MNVIHKYFFPFMISSIFILAWIMQSQMFLNCDVSWLAEASKRMLSGGTYAKDFFENNPPWVLYFYAPAVIVSKIFTVSIIYSLRIYFFLLAGISFVICHYLIKHIFFKQPVNFIKFVSFALAIIFVLLPIYDFGQRDYLLFILSLPYFLVVSLRMQNRVISPYLALFIGLLAGSVFLFKPFFLVSFVLVESYYTFHQRNIFAWIRPEIFSIISLAILYFSILFLRHADYFYCVIPLATRWCHASTARPMLILLQNPPIAIIFVSFLLTILTYEINQAKELTIVILLALTGFLFSYFIQYVNYPYHLLPAFSIDMFLLSYLLGFYVLTPDKKRYISNLMTIFVMLLIYLFSFYFISIFVNFPFIGFIFITTLFLILGYLINLQIFNYKFLILICLSLLVGGIYFYISADGNLQPNVYRIFITYSLLILSFGILLPGSIRDKNHYITSIMLAILIFIIPVYITTSKFIGYHKYKLALQDLISYINNNVHGQSIYFFNTDLTHTYPLINYTSSTSSSRLSFFWFLPGLVKLSLLPHDAKLQESIIKDKKFISHMVVEDILTKNPKYIFLDVRNKKNMLFFDTFNPLGFYEQKYISFDFVKYFDDPDLNHIFQKYHYVNTLAKYYSQKINPLEFQLALKDKFVTDDDIAQNVIYIYPLKTGELEVAIKNRLEDVFRYRINTGKDGLENKQYLSIKQAILSPSTKLNIQDKNAILAWVSKQPFSYALYKFKIFERID